MIRRLTETGPEHDRAPGGSDPQDHLEESHLPADAVDTAVLENTAVLDNEAVGEFDLGEDVSAESEAFQPHLDSFAGPLDLLLYLIHKNEIDIFDIPIHTILDQYLGHLEELQSAGKLDLANAGEFLVMASRLMEIKSRMLLPSHSALDDDEPLEEEVEDPRRSLVEQLLEYRDIKEKAMLLQEAHFQRQQRFERLQHLMIEDPEARLDVGNSTVLDLCAAFQRVLQDLTTRRGAVRVIEMEDIPLEDVIQRISDRLLALSGEPLSFRSLFEGGMSVTILISHFLAVLEMARLRVIRVRQDSDDDIHLLLRVTADIGEGEVDPLSAQPRDGIPVDADTDSIDPDSSDAAPNDADPIVEEAGDNDLAVDEHVDVEVAVDDGTVDESSDPPPVDDSATHGDTSEGSTAEVTSADSPESEAIASNAAGDLAEVDGATQEAQPEGVDGVEHDPSTELSAPDHGEERGEGTLAAE